MKFAIGVLVLLCSLGCEKSTDAKALLAGSYQGPNQASLTLNEDRSYVLKWGGDQIQGSWSEFSDQLTLDPERINGQSVEKIMSQGANNLAESGQFPVANYKVAMAQWRLTVGEARTSLATTFPSPTELGTASPVMFKKQ